MTNQINSRIKDVTCHLFSNLTDDNKLQVLGVQHIMNVAVGDMESCSVYLDVFVTYCDD